MSYEGEAVNDGILVTGTITFSNPCDQIAAALVEIQNEVGNVTTNSRNDHFGNKYADLAAILTASRAVLHKYGCAMVAGAGASTNKQLAVTTMIWHKSGQYVSVTPVATLQKDDPQGLGSAQTYLRRYGSTGLLAIAQEDDDGNAGSGNNRPSKPPGAPGKPPSSPPSAPKQTEKQQKAGLAISQMHGDACNEALRHRPDLNYPEAEKLIDQILTVKSGGKMTSFKDLSDDHAKRFLKNVIKGEDQTIWDLPIGD